MDTSRLQKKKLIRIKKYFLRIKKKNILPQKKIWNITIGKKKKTKIQFQTEFFSKKVYNKLLYKKKNKIKNLTRFRLYPIKPVHIEISYRLLVAIVLYPPQKLSTLSILQPDIFY